MKKTFSEMPGVRWLMAAFFLAASGLGCEGTPSAPSDYQELLAYLFEHMADEEPEELLEGLENLRLWLDDNQNLTPALGGFEISVLGTEAVNGLDDIERSTSGLRGITVVTKSPYTAQEVALVETDEDFGVVIRENFISYERTFDQDPACFGAQECDAINAESSTYSQWAGLIDMRARYQIQFRWVDTPFGKILMHRTWLIEPAGNSNLTMRGNYLMKITMNVGSGNDEVGEPASGFANAAGGIIGGAGVELRDTAVQLSEPGSLRIVANWFDLSGDLPLPEDFIFNLLIQNTKNDSGRIDDWIETYGPTVEPDANIEDEGAEQ